MSTLGTDTWSSARESFADQFEKSGTDFIYRRSQKGEAFRVTAPERDRFLEDFHRNVRRAAWIMYVGMAVMLGAVVLLTLHAGTDLSPPVTAAGIFLAVIPYLIYFRWVWAAPARELAGRIPIARERSSEEVRRIVFRRINYSQLAVAAIAGLSLPFIGSSHGDLLSGWNILWLVAGGVIVLLCVVQAFRKWRFENEDPYLDVARASRRSVVQAPDKVDVGIKGQLRPYLLIAAGLAVGAFLFLTPTGKQLAQSPSFWPILMIGFGGWALFSVWRGFAKGKIEPFARGFYNTYERETQPKRYWASMGWNGVFGCLCLWLAFQMTGWSAAQPIQDRCYNQSSAYSPQEVISACDQLIAGKVSLGGWTQSDIFVDRGIAYANLGQPKRAVADYSAAIRLQPHYPEAYYDRALAYQKIGNVAHALSDYGDAIQLHPQNPDAYLQRGLIYLDKFKFDEAISDFSRSHELNPKDPWPLANRGLAYAWKNDRARAAQDFAAVRAIDPSNYVMSHGEAILSLKAGDTRAAIDHLSTALLENPKDSWSLQMLAKAHRRLGENDKSDADLARLQQMTKAETAQ